MLFWKYFLTLCCIFYSLFIGCGRGARDADDYCHHPDCSFAHQHTQCLFANVSSPQLLRSGLVAWSRRLLLTLHNAKRNLVAQGLEVGQPAAANMRKMYWDVELEMFAESWARQCQKRHDECRNTIRFPVWQSVDVRPAPPGARLSAILSDVVESWFAGSRQTTTNNITSYRSSSCGRGCDERRYTAGVWAGTWRLGCSIALCNTSRPAPYVYSVCNYGPAGNIHGFPIYMVGAPCTSCPTFTKCHVPQFPSLCALRNDPETERA